MKELLFLSLILNIAFILIWLFRKPSPDMSLESLSFRNFQAEINHGRITSDITLHDLLNRTRRQRHILARRFDFGEYEYHRINPVTLAAGRQDMAALILSITNMAECYDIDITEEIHLFVLQNEQAARG